MSVGTLNTTGERPSNATNTLLFTPTAKPSTTGQSIDGIALYIKSELIY